MKIRKYINIQDFSSLANLELFITKCKIPRRDIISVSEARQGGYKIYYMTTLKRELKYINREKGEK